MRVTGDRVHYNGIRNTYGHLQNAFTRIPHTLLAAALYCYTRYVARVFSTYPLVG